MKIKHWAGGTGRIISRWINHFVEKGVLPHTPIVKELSKTHILTPSMSTLFIDEFESHNHQVEDVVDGVASLTFADLEILTLNNMSDRMLNTFFVRSSILDFESPDIVQLLVKRRENGIYISPDILFKQLIAARNFDGLDWFVDSYTVRLTIPIYANIIPQLAANNHEDADKLVDIYIKHGVISKDWWYIPHLLSAENNWFESDISVKTLTKVIGQLPILKSGTGSISFRIHFLLLFYNRDPTILHGLKLTGDECTVVLECFAALFSDGLHSDKILPQYGDLITHICKGSPIFLDRLITTKWSGTIPLITEFYPNCADVFLF